MNLNTTEIVERSDLPVIHAILVDAGAASAGGKPGATRVRPLSGALLIGRKVEPERDAKAWTIDDPRASGRHALISPEDGEWTLSDLGSTNGTTLNGQKLTERVFLNDGDVICFGGQAAVFRRATSDQMRALAEEQREPMGPTPSGCPEMALEMMRLRRLAGSSTEILLAGETGTGKEVIARAIHRVSKRPGPFVAINCAAIPPELVESELFGYARGAHSQAAMAKAGLVERAEGGTLFLDEIGDMPVAVQAKLLRFLQEREYLPLGATTARKMNVRVLAASLHAGKRDGEHVRADLVGRLGAEPIELPPLRARKEDIGILAHHLLGNRGKPFDVASYEALLRYDWPRNVRELQKVVDETAIIAQDAPAFRKEHLPKNLWLGATPSALPPAPVAQIALPESLPAPLPIATRVIDEKALIISALAACHGNQSKAAEYLKMPRRTLVKRLAQYEIARPRR